MVTEAGLISVARMRNAGLLLAACLVALALALSPAPSDANVPPNRCGKIEVGGKTYKVSAHKLDCHFARKWSKRFLRNRDHPRGWDCTKYSREETRIAFSCRKKGKDYYAVRK